MNTAQRTFAALALAGAATGIASPALADTASVPAGVETVDLSITDWHYTIMDAPEYRNLVKDAISAAAEAGVADLTVPVDGNFAPTVLG